MKKSAYALFVILICFMAGSCAGLPENFLDGVGVYSSGVPNNRTIISGLKEALSIGTEKAVRNVSKVNGYFSNQAIKILMPENFQKVANVLSKIGYQKEVDDFVFSMNRAAEKAAPMALSYFVGAIKEMTFEDARGILNGGDTAATEFFRNKTYSGIYDAFKPIISSGMNEVGVTRSYKSMMSRYEAIPFMDRQSLDLDHYVTARALEGLFYMVGQEETRIRRDPAARVTELLKSVFGIGNNVQ